MPKPSILIIPGSFAPPDLYDPVVEQVTARGYEIRALQLPTVGLRAGAEPTPSTSREPPTMYEDAAFINSQATALADDGGKDVILVSHSYGGVPATESVRGVTKKARRALGKRGGVVRLAYMTALVPELGVAAGGVLADADRAEETRVEMEMDDMGWIHTTDVTESMNLVFSDPSLPRAEAKAWMSRMSSHSSTSFADVLTYAGYKDVPVSYLLCEKDVVIPPQRQRDMINMVESQSGRKVDVTSIPADHGANISASQQMVDWIVAMAEKPEN